MLHGGALATALALSDADTGFGEALNVERNKRAKLTFRGRTERLGRQTWENPTARFAAKTLIFVDGIARRH